MVKVEFIYGSQSSRGSLFFVKINIFLKLYKIKYLAEQTNFLSSKMPD